MIPSQVLHFISISATNIRETSFNSIKYHHHVYCWLYLLSLSTLTARPYLDDPCRNFSEHTAFLTGIYCQTPYQHPSKDWFLDINGLASLCVWFKYWNVYAFCLIYNKINEDLTPKVKKHNPQVVHPQHQPKKATRLQKQQQGQEALSSWIVQQTQRLSVHRSTQSREASRWDKACPCWCYQGRAKIDKDMQNVQ